MNLPSKVVRQIQRGEKTQHRVLQVAPRYVERPGPRGTIRTGDSSYYLNQPFRPEIGQSLVVQSADDTALEPDKRIPEVRVLVTDVDGGRLGDLTTQDAQAEGHPSLASFASEWMRRHDPAWPPQTEALCKQCDGHTEYVNHEGETVECGWCELGVVMVDDTPTNEFTIDRFERRHAHHLVYVLHVVHQADVTRYLNRRQYAPPTTSITEALDPTAPLLGPPSREWREKASRHHRDALRSANGARLAGLTTEEDRLVELVLLARQAGVDIGSDLKVIRHRLNAIERKVLDKVERRAA